MKKIILFGTLALIILISGCSKEQVVYKETAAELATVKETVADEMVVPLEDETITAPDHQEQYSLMGTTVSNIKNSGLVALKDNWIYYANFDDGERLYKMNLETSEKIKLNDEIYTRSINIVDDFIYFICYGNPFYKISRLKTDGTDKQELYSYDSGLLHIFEDKIYFTAGERIAKMNLDGSELTYFNDEKGGDINVVEGWIYFDDPLKSELFRMKDDGESKSYVISSFSGYARSNYYTIVGNKIYYSDGEQGNIYKTNLNGSNKELISNDKDTTYLNVNDGWIYYALRKDNYDLYKIKIDGTERTKLLDGQCRNINIIENWIFFVDENKDMYRIDTDGSNKTIID